MKPALAAWAMRARTRYGLTQKELGIRTGIPRGSIGMIENGRQDMSAMQYLTIQHVTGAEHFDTPPTLKTGQ